MPKLVSPNLLPHRRAQLICAKPSGSCKLSNRYGPRKRNAAPDGRERRSGAFHAHAQRAFPPAAATGLREGRPVCFPVAGDAREKARPSRDAFVSAEDNAPAVNEADLDRTSTR